MKFPLATLFIGLVLVVLSGCVSPPRPPLYLLPRDGNTGSTFGSKILAKPAPGGYSLRVYLDGNVLGEVTTKAVELPVTPGKHNVEFQLFSPALTGTKMLYQAYFFRGSVLYFDYDTSRTRTMFWVADTPPPIESEPPSSETPVK